MATTRTYTSWLNDLEDEVRESSRMVQELKQYLFNTEQRVLLLGVKVKEAENQLATREALVRKAKEVIKE